MRLSRILLAFATALGILWIGGASGASGIEGIFPDVVPMTAGIVPEPGTAMLVMSGLTLLSASGSRLRRDVG